MLGFPCAIFWTIFGAHCYNLSIDPWGDIYYYLFFAALGMAIFTMIAAFGLREKRDTIADAEMDEEESEEDKGYVGDKDQEDIFSVEPESEPSQRIKDLRDRAARRRLGESRKPSRRR
jgi:hypothetical protein